MLLTQHALEHLRGRTLLLPEHVQCIIENNLVVSKGCANGYEYLLFYSPPDRIGKIAITTENRERLVSIWHEHFYLPQEVAALTLEDVPQARLLLEKFLEVHPFASPYRVPSGERL